MTSATHQLALSSSAAPASAGCHRSWLLMHCLWITWVGTTFADGPFFRKQWPKPNIHQKIMNMWVFTRPVIIAQACLDLPSPLNFNHLDVDRISSMFNICITICIVCLLGMVNSIDSTSTPGSLCIQIRLPPPLRTFQQLVMLPTRYRLSSTMENPMELDQSMVEEMDKYRS